LQDCHIKTHSSTGEPVVDTSQDYVLLSGSENATHTILRFSRKLNTCDDKSDVPITVGCLFLDLLFMDVVGDFGQMGKDEVFLEEKVDVMMMTLSSGRG
jgi:hypothetical protein